MDKARSLILAIAFTITLLAGPAGAQFSAMTCRPYEHGQLREKLPTMFCRNKGDALAYIDLMERRRTKQITLDQGRAELATFNQTSECAYLPTSHISLKTLHRATEEAPYCAELGLKATKWPSLIEAELSGDRTKIWILTHALVPSPEE